MQNRRTLAGNEGGFTLIELILVTVIIAVLAGMVTLSLRGTSKDAKIRAALGGISTYETAIDAYMLDHNDQYPQSLQDLVSGQKKYVRELKPDPWGHPFVYVIPGQRHPDSYDLYSMGPDGTAGTDDDVTPWSTDTTQPTQNTTN